MGSEQISLLTKNGCLIRWKSFPSFRGWGLPCHLDCTGPTSELPLGVLPDGPPLPSGGSNCSCIPCRWKRENNSWTIGACEAWGSNLSGPWPWRARRYICIVTWHSAHGHCSPRGSSPSSASPDSVSWNGCLGRCEKTTGIPGAASHMNRPEHSESRRSLLHTETMQKGASLSTSRTHT